MPHIEKQAQKKKTEELEIVRWFPLISWKGETRDKGPPKLQ